MAFLVLPPCSHLESHLVISPLPSLPITWCGHKLQLGESWWSLGPQKCWHSSLSLSQSDDRDGVTTHSLASWPGMCYSPLQACPQFSKKARRVLQLFQPLPFGGAQALVHIQKEWGYTNNWRVSVAEDFYPVTEQLLAEKRPKVGSSYPLGGAPDVCPSLAVSGGFYGLRMRYMLIGLRAGGSVCWVVHEWAWKKHHLTG